MWQRHLAAHQLLWQGLGQTGLEPYVADLKDNANFGVILWVAWEGDCCLIAHQLL
jgi:hypothetical protein